MVSGRAGIGLIDTLYQYGLTPCSTISNIIIICNSQNKKEKLMKEFKEKNYKISMEIIVYDKEKEYLKPIRS